MTIRIPLLFCLATLSACSGLSLPFTPEPEPERIRATLAFYGDSARFDLPAEVAAGTAFDVSFRTYGGGCIARGETELEVDGLDATISPWAYDHEPTLGPNGACSLELRVHHREVTLAFDQAGIATIAVIGRREPGDSTITLRREVVVR